MKKRTIIIITSILIPILIIGGIIGGFKMNEQQTKDRQIAFLKEHEQEVTKYILRTEIEKVEFVKFDWDTVKNETGMAFTLNYLSIHVEIYNEEHEKINGFDMAITPDNLENPRKIISINGDKI
ncbi:hypothetical protein [Lactovum odontotermitis]